MKQVFIVQENHPALLLFFAGWGADETPFKAYRPQQADYMVCYDYRTTDFDASLLAGYTTMDVVGWSMGVWAASQVIGRLLAGGTALPRCRMCRAVNGTPFPVDDGLGIPKEIYRGTLEGLSGASLNKFLRRMCGSADAYREFLAVTPRRPLEELREELIAIEEAARATSLPENIWNTALVGGSDRIIPPENQQRAWKKIQTDYPEQFGTCEVRPELPHYSRLLFHEIFQSV
ncbi:MAG: DUF452 family protein [Prevotellaceae bacterium]|jgi:biotin synthesis protein BioG|nr:DUF452 family protein [Prevotellaceae bacterium]